MNADETGIARILDGWPPPNVSAAWFGPGLQTTEFYGDPVRRFALASLTKPLFSMAVLVAVEEGSLTLDDPVDVSDLVGPEAAPARDQIVVTVRQLLSHASGLAPTHRGPHGPAERRRIYSNLGFEVLGSLLQRATALSPADYLHEAVCGPLHMVDTTLDGSPAFAATSTVNDFIRFSAELLSPTLISLETALTARSPQFADLDGVLPGYGRQSPNLWGLGCEIRGTKHPHWMSESQPPSTFGHFGQAGTFYWIDPENNAGCVVLTDLAFGPWAVSTWDYFNKQVASTATMA